MSIKNDSLSYRLELNLTPDQQLKLTGISQEGVKCFLHHWFEPYNRLNEEIFCDAAWDEIYCWPPTRAGQNASQLCSEVMHGDPEIFEPEKILGRAFRFCQENGTWAWDGWTNYSQCLKGLHDSVGPTDEYPDVLLVTIVRYIVFVGSILSVLCILLFLFVFYYFKSLHCDRITIQVHLMLSLLLRLILMIIITEPFIFRRATHYRTVGWICKTVMTLQLYANTASVGWMFVQGHYLNSKVTTSVFDGRAPLRAYYIIGWGIPLILVLLWVWAMDANHETYCWKNYSQLPYIWILVGPMMLALGVNLLFLGNVMRILRAKMASAPASSDGLMFRKTLKAMLVLFPLLGLNNLLFVYNPGRKYEAAYLITNSILHASQGTIVAILYCFLNGNVLEAVRREYGRLTNQRSVGSGTPVIVSSTGLIARMFRKRQGRQGGRWVRIRALEGNHFCFYTCEQATVVVHGNRFSHARSPFVKALGSRESLRTLRKARDVSACLSSTDIRLKIRSGSGVCEGQGFSGHTRANSV